MSWLLAPIAIVLGVLLTTQVATNTQLGKALGNLFIPASVGMTVGLISTTVLTLAVTSTWPSRVMVLAAPWYTWVAGGVLGMIYVTGNIILAPKLGAAALTGLIVVGQLLFSVLLDHFGWLGFELHPAGIARILGCGLLIAGVFLLAKF